MQLVEKISTLFNQSETKSEHTTPQAEIKKLGLSDVIAEADLQTFEGRSLVFVALDWRVNVVKSGERELIKGDFVTRFPIWLKPFLKHVVLHDGNYEATHATMSAYFAAAERLIDERKVSLPANRYESLKATLARKKQEAHIYW